MTNTVETNEELIATARELCEKQIKEWQRTVTFLGGSKDNHAENQLNSWTTHLAEMDEHYNNFVEGNYNLTESTEGWFCQGCYERNETDTPCQKKVTKVKRLLGVE